MPGWVLPLLAFATLAGFIVFAFWQGDDVKPTHQPDNAGGGAGSDTNTVMRWFS